MADVENSNGASNGSNKAEPKSETKAEPESNAEKTKVVIGDKEKKDIVRQVSLTFNRRTQWFNIRY